MLDLAGGLADSAIIPIENSQHGRVADIHFLLPDSGLAIVAEYFMAIRHALMALPAPESPRVFSAAYSHPQALATVQTRLDDVVHGRNPTDPFAARPELREKLLAALRSEV